MTKIKLENRFKSIIITVLLILSGILITINSNLYTQIAICETTWNQTSDRDFDDGTFNNTTITGTGNNAELTINLSGLEYWKRRTPTNNPGARLSHAMASIFGTKMVLMFGGRGDETWVYDLDNDTWINKNPMVNHKHRDMLAMASIYRTDKVILFGGRDRMSFNPLNDTWIYDFSNNTWINKMYSTNPSARYKHAMASIYGTDKVLLFGGTSGGDETWIYDFSNNTWIEMDPITSPISRRSHGLASIWGTEKILLFGGTSGSDETWIYEFSNNTWTQKSPLTNPSARSGHAMASILGDDKVVLFSGYSGSQLNDTWVYDFSDNNWTTITPINPINIPCARNGLAMASVDRTKKVVLFGGYGNGEFLKDTWVYEHFLPLRNGTYDSEPYDTSANSSFRSTSWYADIPSNTNLKIQLRTAATEAGLGAKEYVGPDGNTSSFYVTSGEPIWSGHTGDRWIQYKIYFNMDVFAVSLSLKDIAITYNCLPEMKVLGPLDGSLLSNNKPTFVWTFFDYDSKEQKAFQLLIDDNINFTNVDFDSGMQNSATEKWQFPAGTSYTELPDGIWYWKVRTKDEDDQWTEFTSPWMIRIDTQAPTSALYLPINNGFYNELSAISGIAYDAASGSGLNKIEIAIKRQTDNRYWNGTAWVQLTSWLLATGTTNWTYDTSTIPWTSSTRYSVQFRATDFAINIELLENIIFFTIDRDRPESNIVIPIDNNWVNDLKSISGNSIDIGGSGVKEIKISIMCKKDRICWDSGPRENQYWDGTAWTSEEFWLAVTGTNQWSYNTSTITWTTGDHYLICSRAYDIGGNQETPNKGTTFMYDAAPPENLGIYINNGEEFTRTTSEILSLTAEDIGSGISQTSLSTDGLIWSSWETFNSTRSFELISGDGEKTVYFRVRDYAGNIAEPVSDSIFLDTTAPQDLSVLINEGTKYTPSNQERLDFKAIDTGSGINEMAHSFDGINWQPWETFKDVKYINFVPGDGQKIVYLKANDKAGNIAEPVYDSIILDTTPPYSLSIVINNGALETNSTTVTLELKAKDNTSGVSETSFSIDGATWTSWEPFTSERFFTLPTNDGEKTIYFKVKDKVGNVANPTLTTILLTTTPPKEFKTIKTAPTGNEFLSFFILFIIVVIILVLIIVALVMVIRKKKRAIQELLPTGTISVKPGELTAPVISVGKIPAALKLPQLPGTTAPSPGQQPTLTTPVPMLAKSTQIAQVTVPQPTVQVTQLPQLPPAQTQTKDPDAGEAISVPTQDKNINDRFINFH